MEEHSVDNHMTKEFWISTNPSFLLYFLYYAAAMTNLVKIIETDSH